MLTTAVLAIATLPLASVLRPPRPLGENDVRRCIVLGGAGFAFLAAALALGLLGAFAPGVAAFVLGLAALHLMFWCAGAPRGTGEDGDDDTDDSGGGGGGGGQPRREPRRPIDPGGLGLDWEAFDRERARWEAERREPQPLG